MKTTTLVALIGTTSAAAATLEADCKVAGANYKCTAKLCWATTTIADTATYKACAAFDTDADKGKHGTTADKCQFAGEGCTAAICADHQVLAKVAIKPAQNDKESLD